MSTHEFIKEEIEIDIQYKGKKNTVILDNVKFEIDTEYDRNDYGEKCIAITDIKITDKRYNNRNKKRIAAALSQYEYYLESLQ